VNQKVVGYRRFEKMWRSGVRELKYPTLEDGTTRIVRNVRKNLPIAGVWGWQVGRPPQAPRFRPKVILISLSAIFSGKLEMLIHALFKILLQGQIP
jgi:hypothetical protein